MDTQDSLDLDKPLIEQEFLSAIKDWKMGKYPGLGGFTPRFYKTFAPLLTPPLISAINAIDDSNLPSKGILSANVSILLKPGKDPFQCSSYHTISLINKDLKLFVKVLAKRLSPLLPGVIHRDQVGFVTGREARDNTTKTIHLISYIQWQNLKACLLSFDAEKAFAWSALFLRWCPFIPILLLLS